MILLYFVTKFYLNKCIRIYLIVVVSFLWVRFETVSDLLSPVTDGRADKCFISQSYDATSHFETAANDVLSLYERITGTELDMNISTDFNDEDS